MYFCKDFVELRLFWRTLSVLLIFDMLVVVFVKDFGIQCQEIREENGPKIPDRPNNKETDDNAPSIKGKQHQHIHRLQQISATTTGISSVFATENNTIVIAQIGGTATLPCVVRKFNTGVISWIRRVDYHLLTVGLTTYNADGRFLVEHIRHLQNWGLLIKHVQTSDEGLYECQVSTHPPTSIFVELRVTEASAEITGAPDLHLRAGSTLRLLCTLRESTEQPAYVFWYHEHRMINYDHGVNVSRTSGATGSILNLPDADKTHNGNYTCSPSNAIPASINVHVINATAEEQPAAMQHSNTSVTSGVSSLFLAKYCAVVNSVIVLVILNILVMQIINDADRNFFAKTKKNGALNNRRGPVFQNRAKKHFCGQNKT